MRVPGTQHCFLYSDKILYCLYFFMLRVRACVCDVCATRSKFSIVKGFTLREAISSPLFDIGPHEDWRAGQCTGWDSSILGLVSVVTAEVVHSIRHSTVIYIIYIQYIHYRIMYVLCKNMPSMLYYFCCPVPPFMWERRGRSQKCVEP